MRDLIARMRRFYYRVQPGLGFIGFGVLMGLFAVFDPLHATTNSAICMKTLLFGVSVLAVVGGIMGLRDEFRTRK
jgi:hypothetical protein